MSRDEWSAVWRRVRSLRGGTVSVPGFYIGGARGGRFVTRIVAGGLLHNRARIASLLSFSAAARRQPSDHRHYLTKARALTKRAA